MPRETGRHAHGYRLKPAPLNSRPEPIHAWIQPASIATPGASACGGRRSAWTRMCEVFGCRRRIATASAARWNVGHQTPPCVAVPGRLPPDDDGRRPRSDRLLRASPGSRNSNRLIRRAASTSPPSVTGGATHDWKNIDAGLGALVAEIRRLDLYSVAVPPLGAGLGGLPWNEVRGRIERTLGALSDYRVIVFEPRGAPEHAYGRRAK